MKLFSMSVLSVALMAPAAALACGDKTTTAAAQKAKTCGSSTVTASTSAGTCDGVQQISIGQLAAMQKAKHQVAIFDANRAETRAKYGVVPGAKLLTSYKDYSVDKELPSDKSALLVFYCANQKCTAAPKAAQRAWEAGFQHVYVMHEGIMGWTEAGKPVESPSV